MRKLAAALLLAGSFAGSSHAATEVIRIQGHVPVICRADFQSSPSAAGATTYLGTINEFCNAGSGYQVVVYYAPTANPGTLMIDGRPVVLDGSGYAVLDKISGPRMLTQSLAYVPGTTPLTALRIQLEAGSI